MQTRSETVIDTVLSNTEEEEQSQLSQLSPIHHVQIFYQVGTNTKVL